MAGGSSSTMADSPIGGSVVPIVDIATGAGCDGPIVDDAVATIDLAIAAGVLARSLRLACT